MADRNTVQKDIIYRTLCAMTSHPTAAVVYDRVHGEHPSVSRSTVYRVLARMAEERCAVVYQGLCPACRAEKSS